MSVALYYMCALFRNKYRIGSIRYRGFDYSSPGKYFITICTKNKLPYFGKIENGIMILSDLGLIANKCWREIPCHFPFIKLDEFIIMPDHLHGIIIIIEKINIDVVQTLHATFVQQIEFPNGKNDKMSSISPKTGSLGSVIRSYKSAVSNDAHKINYGFAWQPRFYDHIIRTNTELNRIRKYIQKNPEKAK